MAATAVPMTATLRLVPPLKVLRTTTRPGLRPGRITRGSGDAGRRRPTRKILPTSLSHRGLRTR